ncbi:MAG: MFS transporter [Clostridia bacterium]|nr:MFS transporter [Clostridia bacterium]
MKTSFKQTFSELKQFIILWLTQSLSALGSAMTNFALVIWLYNRTGSALTTALLTVCSYAPYVLMSIFAGAVSDRWNKKTVLLICDTLAAVCTLAVWILLRTEQLQAWHLYALNALNGLMNTVQSPAADVAVNLLTPEEHFQKVSGLRSFSNSLVTILTPVFATALVTLMGVESVIFFDLFTFGAAFMSLLFLIRIPEEDKARDEGEGLLDSAKAGLSWLSRNPGILWLILFLAGINLIASIHNAALPALVLSRPNGGEMVLGTLNSITGVATLIGSLIVTLLPAPKSRVKVVCNSLLVSMSTENFLLALSGSPWVWYLGAVLGWLVIPLMNANLNVIMRSHIPTELQGRVYSVRNSLQFFTIPLGYLLGGALVDNVFEPLMARTDSRLLITLFGTGKGSGAAFLYLLIGFAGVAVCLVFRNIRPIRALEAAGPAGAEEAAAETN